MAEHFQFDPASPSKRPECLACEEMLTDAVDLLLSDADQVFFNRHVSTCTECSAILADAQRGAAWLELLKTPRPEPSAELLTRILASTTDLAPAEVLPAAGAVVLPVAPHTSGNLLPFRPRMPHLPRLGYSMLGRFMLDPRLAMTAAMAFFSIALTLSMSGVHLDQLRAGNLSPAGLKRSFYQTSASAARHYEGLRVVHVLESRADDLRDNLREQQDAAQPRQNRAPERLKTAPTKQPGQERPEKHPESDSTDPHGVSRNHLPAPATHLLLTYQPQVRLVAAGKTGGLA